MRRGANDSDIHSGDKVLVKQDRENKMSTGFNPSQFKVVERNGYSVVVESDQGVQHRRNVTHLKKFHERENTGLQDSVSLENPDLGLPENESSPESPFNMSKSGFIHEQESESNLSRPCESSDDQSVNPSLSTEPRPVRTRKVPSKFDDFVLN